MSRRRGERPPQLTSREPHRRTPQDSVRGAAAWVVERSLVSRSPIELFLESAAERCDERDRGLLYEVVLGTLRWLRRIDHVLTRASNRPLERVEPSLRAPLRIAVYQLLFLDRVPAHAIVHEAVDQAHCLTHRGGASFVNAVLRRIARDSSLSAWPVEEADPTRRLAIELSHPDFLVRRWLQRFGREKTERLLRTNNRARPLQLLAFRDRGGRELLAETLIDEGLEVEPSRLSNLGLTVRSGNPITTEAFRRGELYIQDEISQLSALLPPPEPGETVLDLAASPGGKSLALLACEPEVRLVLADVAPSRLSPMLQNLRRLRLDLPVLTQDALRPAISSTFDRVVLDLPCSGTGTLRKHPEIKWRIDKGEVDRLGAQALSMLAASVDRVKPGGLLVAITCSLEKEENEDPVEALLQQRRELIPCELESLLAPPSLGFVEGPGRWRALPAGDHDGFTVHLLRRRKGPTLAIA